MFTVIRGTAIFFQESLPDFTFRTDVLVELCQPAAGMSIQIGVRFFSCQRCYCLFYPLSNSLHSRVEAVF